MTKSKNSKYAAPAPRDAKRDKEGWKAALRTARKAKTARRTFEAGDGK